jgi:hypothetical protein
MEDGQITRGRGRPRKTIRKDLEINELDQNMVHDRPLWEKTWLLLLLLLYTYFRN